MGRRLEVTKLQRNAGQAQFLGKGDSLIPQWIEFCGYQEGRWQAGQSVGMQRLCPQGLAVIGGTASQGGVPEPLQDSAGEGLAFGADAGGEYLADEDPDDGSLAEGLAHESYLHALSCGTEDKAEGVASFLEKRDAKFTGR